MNVEYVKFIKVIFVYIWLLYGLPLKVLSPMHKRSVVGLTGTYECMSDIISVYWVG